MRCSGPRLVDVRVRSRLLPGSLDEVAASCMDDVWSAKERITFLAALVVPVRGARGGGVDAGGKSWLTEVKEKLAGGGGGEGDGGCLGIGDVDARSHRGSEGDMYYQGLTFVGIRYASRVVVKVTR
jgi:hypothetical protein